MVQAIMGLDFEQAVSGPPARDPANRAILGYPVSRTVNLPLFIDNENAVRAAEETLRDSSIPPKQVKFPSTRDLFRLEPGDLFLYFYAKREIAGELYRVTWIEEGPPGDEEIIVYAAREAQAYTTSLDDIPEDDNLRLPPASTVLQRLDYVYAIEAPWVASGDDAAVIPLAARMTETETGYLLYMSIDGGSSYTKIKTIKSYNPIGELKETYPADTFTVDDDVGLLVDFYNDDVSMIESTTRTGLFAYTHLAMLSNTEIIAFQNIVPEGNHYRLSGVLRGLFDTEKVSHAAGMPLFYVGRTQFNVVTHPQILPGTTRHFKLVPFSGQAVGDISSAIEIPVALAGRARKPYKPGGFICNGDNRYSTNCVLTWSPRVRGQGAGTHIELFEGAEKVWEGVFELEMWEGGSRTGHKDDLEAVTWTFTPTLGGEVTFKLRNKAVKNGITYASDWAEITVTKV